MKNIFFDFLKPYLIAEIGVNHNGDVFLAKKMIESAKNSGADAVKFQTFSAAKLATKDTPKVPYQKITSSRSESHYEMLKKLELSKSAHIELWDYCRSLEIDFLSTPYDVESAKFLSELGVKFFKTASADIVDLPLHQYIASTGKPSIIATGMANLGEVERVVDIYEEFGNPNIVLLHCVSNYPCSDSSINIFSMMTMGQAFSLPVGYSDHSQGPLAATLAVALGAKVVEKHFTLDKEMSGPDHRASSSPSEFAEMAAQINRATKILGSHRKKCQPEEVDMLKVSRKSIVLARSINAGETINLEDLQLMRPGVGLEPALIPKLVGRKVREDFQEGHQLKWRDIL